MKYKDYKLRCDKFRFIADSEVMNAIITLSEKRIKSKRQLNAFIKYHKDNPRFEDKTVEDYFKFAMYLQTAYEIGRLDSDDDLDKIFEIAYKV